MTIFTPSLEKKNDAFNFSLLFVCFFTDRLRRKKPTYINFLKNKEKERKREEEKKKNKLHFNNPTHSLYSQKTQTHRHRHKLIKDAQVNKFFISIFIPNFITILYFKGQQKHFLRRNSHPRPTSRSRLRTVRPPSPPPARVTGSPRLRSP